uniref:SMB domain-containing protein n=1 Tax=Cavia porcellus TaxID=10141 RepID=H0WAV1_CAVPO
MEWKLLPVVLLLLLSVCLVQQVSSQDLTSCAGRCGEGYSRDAICNCDYNCQHYMECCSDFKKVCTTELSCKGRCFESFSRGRECDCDAQCEKYGKCCPDYDTFCAAVKDNKKRTPKKEPAPEPSIDEAGSGQDSVTEVWGIPSPIDTVFTRCNCEGKTFFFKDSQYWRFTNDIKDPGYPKLIVKGFGGLSGNIVAALPIAKHKNRPESVYFFKRGGNIQQYIYKQEPNKKCTGRRPAVHYSVYGDVAQVRRRRFERAVEPFQTHTIRIHYSPVRVAYQDKGFLHNEIKMSTMWRGFPSVVTSAVTLPNIRKPDGYDYYAFSKDQYYNIDVPSRTARAITTRSGQTLSKVWYNCP